MRKFAKDYLKQIKTGIDDLPMGNIEKMAEVLYDAYVKGKQVVVMGNGGSAATASHFVCDLAKGVAVAGKKKRFKIFALCDNIPISTAYANDCGYENIFAEQLKNFLERGDVVIGISASGNSENVLRAIKLANDYSAISIGLTGFDGGKLKDLASECIVVPNNNMERIEDIHLIILHLIKLFLKSKIETDIREKG